MNVSGRRTGGGNEAIVNVDRLLLWGESSSSAHSLLPGTKL